MTFNLQRQPWMREQDAGNFRQLHLCRRLQRVFAGVEQNVRHIHDQAARGVLCLQNGVELRQKLRAHVGSFFLGLGRSLLRLRCRRFCLLLLSQSRRPCRLGLLLLRYCLCSSRVRLRFGFFCFRSSLVRGLAFCIGLSASCSLCRGICLSLCLACRCGLPLGISLQLRIFLRFLLHRDHARLLRGLNGVAR